MNRLQIGVTGGIGSGKSLVCSIFLKLWIPIYNADKRARWLMNHKEGLKKGIRETFGEKAYNDKGEVNRAYLANTVFNNETELKKLNSLVHPAVGEDYRVWQQEQKAIYTIKEAALMFESGSYKGLDYVINVSAPENLRILRVLQRDNFRSEPEIKAIIHKQLTDVERVERSDYVIVNDNEQMIIPQILELHEQFKALDVRKN